MLISTAAALMPGPENIKPHQRIASEWLASKRYALLADDMGLGKTLEAIHACDLVKAERVAVVCPALGRVNWRREFAKWSLLGPSLMIAGYDSLAVNPNLRAQFARFAPDVLILDEAHMLKNRKARRTRAVYGQHIDRAHGIAVSAKRVWLLTGTPAPNNVAELWTHLHALWPGEIQFGGKAMSYMDFVREFTDWTMTDFGVRILDNRRQALPRLKEIMSRICLRRTLDDVPDIALPPLVWEDPYIMAVDTLSPDAKELKQMEESDPELADRVRRMLEAADAGKTRSLMTAADAMAMATLRRLTATLKAKVVAKGLAAELADTPGEKIVIFAHHLEAIELMAEALRRFNPRVVRGGQTDKQRAAAITDFQTDPGCRVAVVQLTAGNHSITLTASARVVFLELSWVPAENAQAAKRCHRIGQSRPVFVRTYALAGSIDEAVQQALVRKARALSELMEN